MAALADKRGNPSQKHPAYLTAPPLTSGIKIKNSNPPPADPSDPPNAPKDPTEEREERVKVIKELYRRLQLLFPGVDPAKEPGPSTGGASRPQSQPGPPNQQRPAGQQQQMANNNNGQVPMQRPPGQQQQQQMSPRLSQQQGAMA